ncbi:uncharacterized protein LOC112595351 [Melanaphis sacchari]|uniref:uncharacterized protein LOC112595351 n=1 Tax=Melanaphis sacchari TaxID=742174 RepID=UPI000DC12ECE|nr:uncharacterized protein LOC112595351 [Melanaphis sacchari]
MVGFSAVFVFFAYLYMSKVLECDSTSRIRCPTIQLDNGRVKLRSSGRVARISCLSPFKLVRGNEIATCVRGQWDTENPICAREGCPIQELIPHGRLDILNQGAKLEVICDFGYKIDGPSYVYCNEDLEWNEELKGCKEHDQIYLSCDFESSDDRFCGWKNDIINDVDWLADKMSFILFISRRHVPPGSSEYFKSNYISLDAGNYGSNTFGRLLSPPISSIKSKQRCLIFAYKVMSGSSSGFPILKVTFGGIPHWETHEGEGRAIIGLYQLNTTSRITIEGKSCKAAIDNIIITEGDSCNNLPYEEEINSCHDNCGKITSGRCSCDWECFNNQNCCSDIEIKCPYIKPMDNITRFYLTTVTPTTLTTTTKNKISNVTILNITTSSSLITTTKNWHNDTIIIDKVTTASNIKSLNVTSTLASVSMTNLTTIPITILIPSITTSTESPKSAMVSNSTISHSIHPNTITTSLSPKVSTDLPSIMVNNQSNSSKIINTSSTILTPNISSSTIQPLIKNKTISITTLLPNVTSSVISKPDKLNPTIRVISIPNTIITKSVVENSPLITTISVNSSNSTAKPFLKFPIVSTIKQINLFNTTNKYLDNKMDNSTSTSILMNNSTKLSVKPNIPNNVEQSSNKLLNTQQIKQNTTINENKTMLNNSMTSKPNTFAYINDSIVPDKNMVIFDISRPNPNLKQFEYNRTLNNKHVLNITTESYNHLDLRNTSIPIQNEEPIIVLKANEKSELNNLVHNHSMQKFDNQLAEHAKQNENEKSFTFDTITIVKYIAVLSVVLLTFKFTLSFIMLRFNKRPLNDEMDERFIETDTESSCNMELMNSHKRNE